MTSETYLDELLLRYRSNFDITKNYKLGDETFPAYAYFSSFGERYVLKKEAQLWAIRAYEHVFFIKEHEVTKDSLDKILALTEEKIEPHLVRKNQKYPEKDHMCSYLTFVIISDKTPDKETQKAIRKFSFDKGYLFNFRGHSEARVLVAGLDTNSVYTSRTGKELRKMFEDAFINKKMSA
ncbi:MAG: hypothetical protein E7301_06105 [Butyrivibrio sp.]|uniref:hypothetical protein n=1 Tax=Butyrivibrio sp. NC2002 TaxID=1410610 RepID=UPI00055D0800|nr:hypothetical protein [Butyrivibrio sp. NC2002]MBE5859683.1 hypothetical protein [Butyrivibrio sp.]